jgi:hypothetical protein
LAEQNSIHGEWPFALGQEKRPEQEPKMALVPACIQRLAQVGLIVACLPVLYFA